MEILFLYIKNLEDRIKDQGLNFGGRLRFNYDARSGTLQVLENPFYIKDFFVIDDDKKKRAKLRNITAIIGQNGAGKTTILDFLKSNFVSGLNGIRNPNILIIENDKGEIIAYHFEDLPISSGNYKDHGINLKPLAVKVDKIQSEVKNLRFDLSHLPVIEDFSTVDFVHFSNIFDGKQEFEWSGMHDLSTNFLIRNDLSSNIENRIINSQLNYKEVEIHLFGEIERQIAFINGYETTDLISFELPEFLFVSSKRDLLNVDFVLDSYEKSELEDYGLLDIINTSIEIAIRSIKEQANKLKKTESYFVGVAFINFLVEIALYYKTIRVDAPFTAQGENISATADIKEIAIATIAEFKRQNEQFKVPLSSKTTDWMDSLIEFFNFLPRVLTQENIVTDQGTSFAINIRVDPSLFKEFWLLYSRTFTLRPYLNFTWRDLSSGEKAILKIYSRFFSITNNQLRAQNAWLKKNVIILIDEGDLYLHPAWQKELISLLAHFLPEIYAEAESGEIRNIQLILTTNSPIPSSDLPNNNIIFLEKKGKLTIIKDSFEERKLTFGANIHTLLADSFYLKNGMMGDFARQKINQVIELLQDRNFELIEEKKEYIQTIISMIGEPVIRNKLTQMLNERISLDGINLAERVKGLSKRVDELESRLNQTNQQ